MPSRSPGRGARVVADTEYLRRSWRTRSPSTSVSFPAPEGPDTTNNRPGPVRTLLLLARRQPTWVLRGTFEALCEREPPVVTDWILIRRAAAELERELRGARVTDAGLLDDGRFGIRLGGRRKGNDLMLAIDIFGSPPLVSLEVLELSIAGDPGWSRSIATALRGLRLGEVRSRPGDRVLVLDFGTTSRFGVTSGAKLVAELVPRFGNLLLLRDGAIIAAAKQF